ncbi:hypothetical protein A4R26_32115 [Niastella populi]|uniref:DUF6443 domain-containing protein n=2 Tax=Niastella populi TaxID=550983 RepID=A0A1V9EK32_9BACT|nr:hypothetical protein A4R26_32115 [Niastella populi]
MQAQTPVQPGIASPAYQIVPYYGSATITISGISGGNGSYSTQWLTSSNADFSNPEAVQGGTSTTSITVTRLTATTYYRLYVSSNGVSALSNIVQVDVSPKPDGNAFPPYQIVRYNGTAATITAIDGGNNCSYQWLWSSNADFSNPEVVQGGTNTTSITPTGITAPTYYRMATTCNGGPFTYSSIVQVDVYPKLNGNELLPAEMVIPAGGNPGLLSAGHAFGGGCNGAYSYQWQWSSDGITFNDINQATGLTYEPGPIMGPVYYRRKVRCDVTGEEAFSNAVHIVIGAVSVDNQNYIRIRNFTKPGIADVPAADAITLVADVKQTTEYYDGLGRLMQTVNKQAGKDNKDLVQPVIYDQYGRQPLNYLPFVSPSDDGKYKPNVLGELNDFHKIQNAGESFYYSNVLFEPSPLNRIVKTLPAGNSWFGSDRGVENKYAFNTAADNVKIWTVTNVANDWGSYVVTGAYAAGQLYKNITVDEKGSQVIEFKNKNGQVVLKKVQLTALADDGTGKDYNGWLCTYYIYDDINLLRAVIQPRGVERWINAGMNSTLSDEILNELCFRYEYDARNRMIMKKVPGADPVYMVYDKRDRQVMIQDGNMRAIGKWVLTTYDDLNRPIETELLTGNTTTFDVHQLAATTTIYYRPSGDYELLTVTHYDDYSNLPSGLAASYLTTWDSYFSGTDNNNWPYPQMPVMNTALKNMVTWKQTKILGSNPAKYIYSAVFYDDKGRVIQTQTKNDLTGGLNVVTTQYTWAGQPLITIQRQQTISPNAIENIVVSKITYDDLGRVIKTEKKVGNSQLNTINSLHSANYVTISESTYDALGQPKTRKLGREKDANGNYTGSSLETLTYDYNIRGWVLGVNRDFIRDQGNSKFGFELAYDKKTSVIDNNATNIYTQAQFNGNIAGTIWKSMGDGMKRKYDFDYDAANRLTGADFNQYNGTAFDRTAGVDFSVSNLTYDANGNILTMKQMGLKSGSGSLVDDLKYTYIPGTNKLQNVNDFVNNAQTILGDFRTGDQHPQKNDKTALTTASTTAQFEAITDYMYDKNGNMVKDLNKGIAAMNGASGIEYNYLNLPAKIAVQNKGTIEYVYDAAGNKLQKITTDNSITNKSIITTTTYDGGMVFESKTTTPSGNPDEDYSNVLQFIAHEEGRIRFSAPPVGGGAGGGFNYDYFIKDHLGNVRMVLTEERQQHVYPAATLEGDINNSSSAAFTEKNYYNINAGSIVDKSAAFLITDYENNNGNPPYNNNPNSNTTALSQKLYKLDAASPIGLGITLKVMAGDQINIFGKSYYYQPGKPPGRMDLPLMAADLLNMFVSGGPLQGKGITSAGLMNDVPGLTTALSNYIINRPDEGSSKPRSYINWVIFDEQFHFVTGGFDPVGDANFVKTHNNNTIPTIPVTKNGYIFIFCNNETQTQEVFFDNLQVVQNAGPLLEETHYYPFGLTMAGISSKALNFGAPENKHKFNGIEQNNDFDLNMYDAFYRNLDPQIGRFWQIDPKPNEVLSPYSSMGNNPILLNDPLGDTTYYYGANGQYYGRVLNKGSEAVVVVDEKYNEQFQAYHGNNFKDFKGRKADDLVKEFGQYGVTYDAAAMSKYYDDNNGTTKAEKVDGTKIDDMKNPTFNGKPVSKQFLKSLNAEMLGNLVLKDGKVTVGTGRHSDNDLVKNSPGSLPYEEGKVAHIHNHPPMKPFSITWEVGAFNATSGVSGSPGAGPSSADYSQSSGNTPYRNVVVDQKNIYFINGSQTVKHPR